MTMRKYKVVMPGYTGFRFEATNDQAATDLMLMELKNQGGYYATLYDVTVKPAILIADQFVNLPDQETTP